MRRSAVDIVPRRIAAVDQLLATLAPRPDFDQRMHPEIQVVHCQIGPDVAHLLLARSPHFFHVVEILFDGSTIGKCFENLLDAGARVGAEEGVPTMIFFHQHDANDATHRRVGCQEGLVGLGRRLAVDRASNGVNGGPKVQRRAGACGRLKSEALMT